MKHVIEHQPDIPTRSQHHAGFNIAIRNIGHLTHVLTPTARIVKVKAINTIRGYRPSDALDRDRDHGHRDHASATASGLSAAFWQVQRAEAAALGRDLGGLS